MNNDFLIIANQTPGTVTFDNYEEVKTALEKLIRERYTGIDYNVQGIDAAKADFEHLKEKRDIIKNNQEELDKKYQSYIDVKEKLEELDKIIKAPFSEAKKYIDNEKKREKHDKVMSYARKKANELGGYAQKIIGSQKFFNPRWLNATCTVAAYQKDINQIIEQAGKDIQTIQMTGGAMTEAMLANYFESLSMDSVKRFAANMREESGIVEDISVESENNVRGYKVLRITGTEDQMAAIMDQLQLMNVEVEEVEDGMPKPMQELKTPDFDSFVAFDIETSGTFGAANGDGEAKITEIGAVKVVNGEVVDQFDQLANPGRKIVPKIAKMTNITDDMVADKPPVDEVIRRFHEFVGDSVLIGHNIKMSDLRYITKAANKAGVHFDVPFLDTYLLAKDFKQQMKWDNLKLDYLSKELGFEHKEVHRAWSDAEVNAQLYFALKELFKNK